MFSETLEKSRDFLETGEKVVVTVEATLEADQLKLLGRAVAPIDGVVADAGGVGLKIFVDEEAAIVAVAQVLADAQEKVKQAARGPIRFCLMDHGLPGEVEIDSGREFPVTPQIKGAICSSTPSSQSLSRPSHASRSGGSSSASQRTPSPAALQIRLPCTRHSPVPTAQSSPTRKPLYGSPLQS